jgi:hypothetical protein
LTRWEVELHLQGGRKKNARRPSKNCTAEQDLQGGRAKIWVIVEHHHGIMAT